MFLATCLIKNEHTCTELNRNNLQCAAHLNLGWRIVVMDPDPLPTTDSELVNTQPITDGEIIIGATTTTTMNGIGEFTTTEEGSGTVFGQVFTSGATTTNIFLIGLISAAALAILTSVF